MFVIEIVYGGSTYHVNDRSLGQLQAEIARVAGGGIIWLEVIDGGGPAYLLVSEGVPIALIPPRGAPD